MTMSSIHTQPPHLPKDHPHKVPGKVPGERRPESKDNQLDSIMRLLSNMQDEMKSMGKRLAALEIENSRLKKETSQLNTRVSSLESDSITEAVIQLKKPSVSVETWA